MHALRIENADAYPPTLALIKKLKLGRAKGWHDQKRATQLKAKLKARLSHLAVEIGKTGGLSVDDLGKVRGTTTPSPAARGPQLPWPGFGRFLTNALSLGQPERSPRGGHLGPLQLRQVGAAQRAHRHAIAHWSS